MKGIAHFLTGVALSTFLPGVVRSAAGGRLLPVLGGVAGLLPDTLDFKFVRFFERYDVAIDPGPDASARRIATEIAEAMIEAHRSGRARTVKLHTARAGADLWRQYIVRVEPQTGEVVVRAGPLVSTAQAALPGSAPARDREARVSSGVTIAADAAIEVVVDAFSGPTLTFARSGRQLEVRFLDWHRRWTHSVMFAAALGLVVTGIAAIVEAASGTGDSQMPVVAGLVATMGVLGHIVEDQLGTMGSNLLFPFSSRRTRGLGWLHSADAIPNLLAVWVSSAVILLNLDRFGADPRLDPMSFVGVAIAIPILVLGSVYRLQRRRDARGTAPSEQHEIASEMADAETA